MHLIFSRHGLCDTLVSDNASCFTASDFKLFLGNNGIQHVTPPPYSPSSNGQAERGVRVLKDLLKKNVTGSFKSRLAISLMYYRTVPHSTTLVAPSVALNNRKYITLKDRINPRYSAGTSHNVNSKQIPQMEIGDEVLALNLRDGPKWYHATVVEKLGINVYNVHIHELDVIWKRHLHQLIRGVPSRPDSQNCTCTSKYQDDDDVRPANPTLTGTPFSSGFSNLCPQPVVRHHNGGGESIPPEVASSEAPRSVEPQVVLRKSDRIRKPVIRYGFDD